tara:strand:+ start:209 stop:400 length:192 start_codon:yes stop_codon:yes gene_type:complete
MHVRRRNDLIVIARTIVLTIDDHHRSKVFAIHRLIREIADQMFVCDTCVLADLIGLGDSTHRQ